MSFSEDFSTHTMAISGPNIRAIGWLSDGEKYPKGGPSKAFMEKLREHCKANALFGAMMGFEQYFGGPTCELCNDYQSGGVTVHGLPCGLQSLR